jgi:hypothetical protein
MYIPGMFDVRLLMVERCGVLIGVGVSTATVGLLLRDIKLNQTKTASSHGIFSHN